MSDEPTDANPGEGESDPQKKRRDRELIELLNELRVVLPGIQVLFAFLLAVPFTQGWLKTTELQRNVFYAAFLLTAVSTVLLITPTSYHRLRWRARDKEQLLVTSNRLTVVGVAFLALAMSCVVFFITDFIYDTGLALFATAVAALLFAWFWFGMPLLRASRSSDPDD